MNGLGMQQSVLVVRLGAMGDVLHALPAVASLKQSLPQYQLLWAMAPQWIPLVDGNPFVDDVVPFDRRSWTMLTSSWRRLRQIKPEFAIDFQGLIQSALVSRIGKPHRSFGFHKSFAREPLASIFYTDCVAPKTVHVVDQNLELVRATGASVLVRESWIPAGREEGTLPQGPFVLANPLAGWKSKQWPLQHYSIVAQHLQKKGVELVANVPPQAVSQLGKLDYVHLHTSSIAGLISATRKAAAVLGLDSGPLHLAAALRKPGVALFGPTSPERNGPYGGSIAVLRSAKATTTYKRESEIHPSMMQIRPEEVAEVLLQCMAKRTAAVEAVRES